MKRISETVLALTIGAAVSVLCLGPIPRVSAQSPKVAGRDVPSAPESWFKRVGIQNPNNGCDSSFQYGQLNYAQLDDCSAAGNPAGLALAEYTLGGLPGAAGSSRTKEYVVNSIADATATAIFTVTVPNAAEGASIGLLITTGLGAGGAVGDWECTATAYGQLVVERVAGAATVKGSSALSNTASACSSGATTITLAQDTSGLTGTNSAVQTFTVRLTISKGGGSSANHHAIVEATLQNALASGVTIS